MKLPHLTPILASLSLLVAGTVHAGTDPFEFDPDGPGSDAPITVNSLDWLPGSSLSIGSVPLPVAPENKALTTLAHAKLGNFINSNGQVILGTGLNSAYELTMVTGIPEIGTRWGSTAIFSFDSTGTSNFFEVWWDPSKDSNALAGTGYNNGTLILSGVVTAASSTFNVTNTTPVNFDQYISDNYPAIDTVTGGGGGADRRHCNLRQPELFPEPVARNHCVQHFPDHSLQPDRPVGPVYCRCGRGSDSACQGSGNRAGKRRNRS